MKKYKEILQNNVHRPKHHNKMHIEHKRHIKLLNTSTYAKIPRGLCKDTFTMYYQHLPTKRQKHSKAFS